MSEISERVDDLVSHFGSIGMTWSDVQVAASLLHSKKIQEILISTFSSFSVSELREVAGHAYARANAPPVTATSPVAYTYVPEYTPTELLPVKKRKR